MIGRQLQSDSHALGTKIRVLVADSSRMHTDLLAEALKRELQFEVLPFYAASERLVSAIGNLDPDVLLISANLNEPLSFGFEILRRLRVVVPQVRIVVLLDSSDDERVANSCRAGARRIRGISSHADQLCQSVTSV